MRDRHLAAFAFLVAAVAGHASAQRLEPPGSVADGGKFKPISPVGIAERCERPRYRAMAKVECARSDAYQAQETKRRTSHR